MARILKNNFKKYEDLYIFACIIELFFVREFICFGGFFYLQICINQMYADV